MLNTLILMVMAMRYLLMLFGLMVGSVNAEEGDGTVYYCSEEASGGVSIRDGKWVGGGFQLDRYTMKLWGSESGRRMKMNNRYFDCISSSKSSLICQSKYAGNTVILDLDTGRYLHSSVSPYSYVLGKDTPTVSVGTCETF